MGLLRPSFIPADEVAGLRQRTRYRKKLIQQRSSEGQRLSKVLEDAGIKIDSVASKLLIKSGRKMIAALIAGERNPGRQPGRGGEPGHVAAGPATMTSPVRCPAPGMVTSRAMSRPDGAAASATSVSSSAIWAVRWS